MTHASTKSNAALFSLAVSSEISCLQSHEVDDLSSFPVYLVNISPSLPTNGSYSSRITDYRAYAASSLLDDGTLLTQMAKHCPCSRGHHDSIQKATTKEFTHLQHILQLRRVHIAIFTNKQEQFKFQFVLEIQ